MKREPVLLALLPVVLTELGFAVERLASDHTTGGIMLAVAALLTSLGAAVGRALVTPVAAPDLAALKPARERLAGQA